MIVRAAALLLAVAPFAAAQEITFRFAPPVGKTFVQKLETTATDVTNGKKNTRFDSTETALTYEKRDGGYLLHGRVRGASVEAMRGIEITYAMAASGQVSEIGGLDRVVEATLQNVDPSLREQYAAIVTEDALVNREAAEWGARIGTYVGKTVTIGDSWAERTPFPIPGGGELSFYVVTTFQAFDVCPAGECVRISFTSSTDAAKLGEVVKKVLKGDDVEMSGFVIEGSGERLIDPKTMTIYAETMERTIEVRADDATSTRKEVRKYTFTY